MPRKKTDTLDAPPTPRSRSPRTKAAATTNGAGSAPRVPTYDEIAQAAYLRYINRGGGEGSDFDDWLAAERDLASGS